MSTLIETPPVKHKREVIDRAVIRFAGDSGDALPRNLAQLADALNAHADKLNARLFSSMDYVVVARR